MVKVYYDQDADLSILKGKKIAVMGYGSQGHAQAQNLKESGLDVIVGLYEGSKSRDKAKEAGLEVYSVAEAAAKADIIQIVTPDETQAATYQQEIAPSMTQGLSLIHIFPLMMWILRKSLPLL